MEAGLSPPMRSATPQENGTGIVDWLAQEAVTLQFAATAKSKQPKTEHRDTGERPIVIQVATEILDV